MTKIDRLREKLEENKVDAIIVDSPYNRRYITNFTGTAGTALVTADKAIFITDFRYTEQAAEQAEAFEIVEHKHGMNQEIANQIDKLGVKKLAFEKNYTTYSQFETYQHQFSQELVPVEGIIEALRMIKTDDELAVMKKAAKIADDAFAHIQSFIQPGVPEIEISNELEFFMRRQGATSSSFDTIVASGLRSALPHGVASTKKIQEGELVTLDYGALYDGYCSDITRTVAVGEISVELREIYDIVLEANLRGVKGTKPGMTGKEADALTRDYITEKGFGERFGHSTGHALGMEVHEGPGLSSRSEAVLKTGMVVTVEPGIYVPGLGGCRIEDDIVITDSGNERLTFAPKEFIQL
ncbi:Xaa-Pro peptidase family protein [Oceanobacillus sp. FSL W8-0428]|uniref:Xaa-Pro dipeptidase n=1 Tax=Oceanobacillus sojae TaxID=582851 RepID=A0A511ZIY8_9BACI|nr:Xaa-Pro peptidase family protein [Oceanobacillus sojae]GEN87413.1 Xaa-Pro dipeptidase [Oceanobacillus sojae]